MSKIQVRRGTATEWSLANPVLASGEPGFDTTNSILKTGDGATPWGSLPVTYASGVALAALQAAILPTAWATPAFATGWQSYGGGYTPVAYRKVGDLVYCRGLCQGTTGVTSTMWTFPAGFRPPAVLLTYVGTSAGVLRRIDVQTSGLMTMTSPSVGEWFALDQMTPFSVTA